MDVLKVQRFSYRKILHNIGHHSLVAAGLKDFSPGIFKRLFVTHSRSTNNGSLELENELIIFSFFKVAPKATVVNSDS